jgi:hypothetical protein
MQDFDIMDAPKQGLPTNQRPTADDVGQAAHQINIEHLKQVIQHDPKVEEPEKSSLLNFLNDPDALSVLAGGVAGGAITNTISKFLGLSHTAQILLSLAGFGLGSILVKSIGKDQAHLVSYNKGQYHVN